MPYTTGSQGTQTNCASVFMATLDTALVAGGLTFVEQVVNATVTTRVYKSPAASNFFGQDWFLIMKRSSDTNVSVDFSVTELYNSTTHLCTNYAPSTASLTPTASFAVNDATGKAPDSASLYFRTVQINTTGFAYFLSILPSRVVIATRVGSSDYAVYAGLYDDLQSISISPFPLIVWNPTSSAASASRSGAATREPATTTSNSGNFNVFGLGSNDFTWTRIYQQETYSGKSWLSRARISDRNVPTGSGIRGLARDLWVSYISGVNGDTLAATINGTSTTLVQARDSGTGTAGFFVDTAL